VDFETDEESLKKLLEQWNAEVKTTSIGEVKLSNFPTGRRILAASPEAQLALVRCLLSSDYTVKNRHTSLGKMLEQLFRRSLPYEPRDVKAIVDGLMAKQYPDQSWLRTLVTVLKNLELLEASRPKLEELRSKYQDWYECVEKRKFLKLLEDILNPEQGKASTVRIAPDEWGTQARAHLETLTPDLLEHWQAVLKYAATAKGSKPAQKWLEGAKPVLEGLGDAEFARLMNDWLGFFCHSSFKASQVLDPSQDHSALEIGPEYGQTFILNNIFWLRRGSLLENENADLLRALIWLSSTVGSESLASSLASAALAAFRKIPGHGPRSPKIGTACVWALENMNGMHAAAQLERVRLGVKQPQYQKTLEGALNRVSERVGLSREDLEELTVPGFDLEHGWRSVTFGDARAELTVSGSSVEVAWFGADGKPRKAAPTSVKSEFKDDLKAHKKTVDDLEKMLSAQSSRLERLPLSRRSWPLPIFRERYLEHPLIITLVSRLIWHVQDGGTHYDAFWLEGKAVNAAGEALEFSENATVTPWHPVFCDASEVLAWREFLERTGITQPFKQAHREIYLLTEAERRTSSYSNRFAAHILKQHQFNALCAARGWLNKLRLMVDDVYPAPSLELPQWNLRAEFWVEGAGDHYGTDTNETGTYLYLATDQVRFYPLGTAQNYAHAGGGGYSVDYAWNRAAGTAGEPLALEQIPPLVLSETLRDVDLFVGVCSVGGDPSWRDGGPQGHRAYWESYSFGELSSSAEERKKLLERLLPRLKIRDKTSLEGRFLRVRGELRSYKIHLGSGNILMDPNDQYLCIVPGSLPSSVSEVRLPFEGDRTLAVILSKAFLLASDTQITDPTITRQLTL